MKRPKAFNFLLILIIAFSFLSFLRAVSDDDDLPFDLLCKNNDVFQYVDLLLNAASKKMTLYEHHKNIFSSEPFITYLSRYEKSPPLESPA